MSKYIKLEDAEDKMYQLWEEDTDNKINSVYCFDDDRAIEALRSLPTIEVSEDCISREEVYRAIITCGEVDNDLNHLYEVIENFPSVVPTADNLSAVEDCISREYMKSLGYINKGDFNSVETIREWIDNAPSVIPQQKEEETPTCSECDHYEDHHASLACANCPVITKVWGGTE